MKYMGSKNRHAKELLPIILANRKEGQWYVEPFVGGANMIDKVEGLRIGADSNDYLISLWQNIKNGWTPPDFVSEELWKDVRIEMDKKYSKFFIAFVRFGCSFGADWNGGYARNVRKTNPNADILNKTSKSYCRQSKNNIMKQKANIEDVVFKHSSYSDLEIPSNSIIYCDPPYANTTKYKANKEDFEHDIFWQWCRDKALEGHDVFVSEYNAPDDFVCVWEKKTPSSLNNNIKKEKATEKLFVHVSQHEREVAC